MLGVRYLLFGNNAQSIPTTVNKYINGMGHEGKASKAAVTCIKA